MPSPAADLIVLDTTGKLAGHGGICRPCRAPKWAVAVPYVVVGWCALVVLPQLLHALGGAGFGLLAAGGGFYTLGAVIYATRQMNFLPRRFGFHEEFHLFVLGAAATQYAGVAFFMLPR